MISAHIVSAKEWDQNLQNFNPGCLMNTEWVESIADIDKESIYINFIESGNTIGKIGGLIVYPKKASKKHLYFYSGPALREESAHLVGQVLEQLILFASRTCNNRVVIRSYDYNLKLPNRIKSFRVSSRKEYIVNLSGTIEAVSSRFSKSARKHSNKAKLRFNLTLEETKEAHSVDKLVTLMEETRRIRLSKGYADYNYYYIPYVRKEVLIKLLSLGRARIFYVKNSEGEINCIRFVLANKPRAFSLYIGTNEIGYSQRSPNFMNYELAIKLCSEGYSEIGLGGVQSDSSRLKLSAFKKSVGGVLVKRMGGSTNYLIWPKNLLNPLMEMARGLPELRIVNTLKKKYL